MSNAYTIKVDVFEGPMDLLLHLINRLEIDIYDIPMAEITEQYLAYIHTMKNLELDIASEYLVMAATLLAIKSKQLLPKHEEEMVYGEDGMEIEEEDPREELVEKLLEYKKYKQAAVEFKAMEEERSLIFTKPPSDLSEFNIEAEQVKPDPGVTIFDMLGALQKLMNRKKLQKPLHTKVTRQEISIEKRMGEILNELRSIHGRRSFFDLFPIPQRDHIVITFLAVLELMKQNEILVEQEGNFTELYIASKEGAEAVGSF